MIGQYSIQERQETFFDPVFFALGITCGGVEEAISRFLSLYQLSMIQGAIICLGH